MAGSLAPVMYWAIPSTDGKIVVLASHGQVSDLPIGCLIVIGDQADHYCVIGNRDVVGVVPGHTVMSEQGVQEGTEHAPLKGPRVECQHGGCVVTHPYHLGLVSLDVMEIGKNPFLHFA